MYQPIKTGVRERKYPDHSVFDGTHSAFLEHSAPVFLIKETFGHANINECCFQLFPDQNTIHNSKPLFLFREPVATWNSWKKLCFAACNETGVSDLNLFLKAYFFTYQLFLTTQMDSPHVKCITREFLLKQPQTMLAMICQHWNIPFSENMIHWDKSFNNNQNFFCAESERKSFSKIMTVLQGSSVLAFTDSDTNVYDSLVTELEREEIKIALQPLYAKIVELSEAYFPITTKDMVGSTV
jgi:hypothetical protein